MKIDIKKTVQYRYIQYRLNKRCLRNKAVEGLSKEDKDEICIKAARRTRSFTFIYIPFYIAAMLIFHFGFIMNAEYVNNDFVIWHRAVIESVIPLIDGYWGSTWLQKAGAFLVIYIKLIPVGIIYIISLLVPVFIAANIILQRIIADEYRGSADTRGQGSVKKNESGL